ncbi:MAG: hypothetical protein RR162_00475 [Oscillospiraceae bacterium]
MPVPIPIAQAQVQETAKSVANKALNGAQTQSLIMVIQQYQSKALTLQQAVNIIALSIGISKDDAKELIGETMLQSGGEDDTLEKREQSRDKNGRFGKTAWDNKKARKSFKIGKKENAKISSEIATNFPKLQKGDLGVIHVGNYKYSYVVNDFGNYGLSSKKKLK